MRTLLSAALCGTVMFTAAPAFAQDKIDVKPMLADACAGDLAPEAIRGRLAISVLRNARVIRIDEAIRLDDAIKRLDRAMDLQSPSPDGPKVRSRVSELQGVLGEGGGDASVLGMSADPRAGRGRNGNWLFGEPVTLKCFAPPERSTSTVIPPSLRLRGSVDDLQASGNKRASAGSATIGYLRERTTQDNGTVKTTTTASFKGVLGYAVPGSDDSSGLILYGGYELKRVRTNPPPTLAPGKSQRDGDTDIIQVGVKGYIVPRIMGGSTLIETTGTVLFDQVKDSRRLRFEVAVTPSFRGLSRVNVLGRLCGFGAFNDSKNNIIPGLRARCGITGVWQVSHYLEKGTATVGTADELVFVGGRLSFDIAPAAGSDLIPDKSGLIAGASYQYLQRFHGSLPSIDRFSTYVKYRYWIDATVGVDFGVTFTDGINPDSFADENKLQFSVGLIF